LSKKSSVKLMTWLPIY